ncbi:tetratricopeptide repeat protein [Limibacter armeniacum]|uniref:tetratricopeptide repeat protein n=1 Tax=Limibacter armeniacum TaxID=466084 RepID=UPI002FE57E72
MRRIVISIAIVFAHISLLQAQNVDSLLNLYPKQQGVEQVKTINEAIGILKRKDSKTGIELASVAIETAEGVEDLNGLCETYKLLGDCYFREANYSSAIESYQKAISTAKSVGNGTIEGKAANNMAVVYYRQGAYEKALKYYHVSLATKENDKSSQISTFNNIALIHNSLGQYDKAKEIYNKALKVVRELQNKQLEGDLLSNLGLISQNQGDYIKALEEHLQSLRIRKELGDEEGMGISYHNVALVHQVMENFEDAIFNFDRSISLKRKSNDENGLAQSYIGLAAIHMQVKDFEKAINYFEKGKEIDLRLGNKPLYANDLMYLGNCYLEKGELDKALVLLDSSITLSSSIHDKLVYAKAMDLKSKVMMKNGNVGTALQLSNVVLDRAEEMNALELIVSSSFILSEAYSSQKNYKQAYLHHHRFKELSDSLFNAENTKKFTQKAMQYEFDAQQRIQQVKQEKKEAEQRKELEFKQKLLYLAMAVVVIVTILMLLLVKANRRIKSAFFQIKEKNIEIEQQAEEIMMQRDAIEEKSNLLEYHNNSIKASINYARRIQRAMLVSLEEMQSKLEACFVLFRPKDIVSGDFYYFTEVEKDGRVLQVVAAVDCTGHGVPGAFMSIISNSLLNEIIHGKKITAPAEILNELDSSIKQTLKQHDSGNRDGMDISICCIDEERQAMTFAGAKNPLLYFKNGVLHQVKADRMSVGGHYIYEDAKFTEHTVLLDSPVMFYLFSDGYQDQFGGAGNRKFMLHRFKKLLDAIKEKSCEEQHDTLKHVLEDWMVQGGEKQIDDVLVVGALVGVKKSTSV